MRMLVPTVIGSLLLTGCNVYETRFAKGGELTSHLLERIEERPGEEDDRLPPFDETTTNPKKGKGHHDAHHQ
ncbi:MAG: hypothetical protein OXF02_02725 [Simkaniaceae bacterium]|nr:hypothetical protein [Simkaniaceae bacterium]